MNNLFFQKKVKFFDESAELNARGNGHKEYIVKLKVWESSKGKIRLAGENLKRKELRSLKGFVEGDLNDFSSSLLTAGFTKANKDILVWE